MKRPFLRNRRRPTRPWIGRTSPAGSSHLLRLAKPARGCAIALAGVLVAGCHPPADLEPYPLPPPTVGVEQPRKADFEDFAELIGRVEASARVEIRAQVEGALLSVKDKSGGQEDDFVEGSQVAKGDLLFVIESARCEARLHAAEAARALAEARVAHRQQQCDRIVREIDGQETDAEKAAETQAALAVARAELLAARAEVERAQADLALTEIRAPIAGVVGRRLAHPGDVVAAGENTLLTTITVLDPVHVDCEAEEEVFSRLVRHASKQGGASSIKVRLGSLAEQGFPVEAKLGWLDDHIDPVTRRATVRVVCRNADRVFRPGQRLRVRVPLGIVHDAILVDSRAIRHDARGKYLLVLGEGGIVEQRRAGPATRVRGSRAVLSLYDPEAGTGLRPDDLCIVEGFHRARPGLPVLVESSQGGTDREKEPTEADADRRK